MERKGIPSWDIPYLHMTTGRQENSEANPGVVRLVPDPQSGPVPNKTTADTEGENKRRQKSQRVVCG